MPKTTNIKSKLMNLLNSKKTIKIGELFYKVRLGSDMKDDASIDFNELEIVLDRKDVAENDILLSLLRLFHEINHGYAEHFEAEIILGMVSRKDKELMENIIQLSAKAWLMLLVDNTELIKRIIKEIEKKKKSCSQ